MLKEALHISAAPCDRRMHTYVRAHRRRTHVRAHKDDVSGRITPAAFDTHTSRVLPPLTSSLSHSLSPKPPSGSPFLAAHTVQKLYSWPYSIETQSPFSCIQKKPPLERPPSHPGWRERAQTELDLFFSHYHFHTGLSHLAFGWCVPYPPHPARMAFSRSELNDQLDNRLINELFLMSVHAHCRV